MNLLPMQGLWLSCMWDSNAHDIKFNFLYSICLLLTLLCRQPAEPEEGKGTFSLPHRVQESECLRLPRWCFPARNFGKYWAQALFRVFLESPRRGTCPAWIQALQSTGIIRVNVLCTLGSLYKSKSCYRYHDYIPLATATRTLCICQDVLLRPQDEVTKQVPEVLEDGGAWGVVKVEEREKAEQRLESGN